MDVGLLRLARTAGHGARADRWVRAYSSLGEHAGLWLALGLAGATLDRGRRRSWRRALGTVSLAYAVNQAIKLIVRRPRPELADLPPLIVTPTRLSFPSAHATSSFAAARAFRPMLPARALDLTAATLALSRVYLGVHYPSDVAAGAILGSAIARLRGPR